MLLMSRADRWIKGERVAVAGGPEERVRVECGERMGESGERVNE